MARTALGLGVALLLGSATAASAGEADEAGESASIAAPAASRWSLPATNLSRRAVLLGASSQMGAILSEQASPVAGGLSPTLAVGNATAPVRRADIATGDHLPNVFGSVALAVRSTPLDRQWRQAGAARPASVSWGGRVAAGAGHDPAALLAEVNRRVNASIHFADDRSDAWSSAADTLRRGRGDCEDYALAKLQILTALGFDANRLFLVVVRDLTRRADHAVLVAELDGRFLVLDNMTDQLLDSNAVQDYRPIISYSGSRRWIHGYPYEPALQSQRPIRVAAIARDSAP